ncbi:MAG: Gfo/Idh/MocA family oxidoreductase [Elusimicrobia bacterium]|nr:Gfo/Idh/MocA family oxidoreductase [Elusimicrobiota bacterium]
MRYKAAIIGLGQIGSAFDSDPKRKEIWTHARAYQSCPEIELAAGADLDAGRRETFRRARGLDAVYSDWRQMLAEVRPDIVSVCTPVASHHELASALIEAGVPALFLEKPMAEEVWQAREIVEAAERRGVVLAVNHLRRWDRVVAHAKALIAAGDIGEIKVIGGWYSEKIYNIGTHLLDAIAYLGGEIEEVWGREVRGTCSEEPTAAGLLSLSNGAHGFIACSGKREDFIFELDVLGSKGRLRLTDNCRRLELYKFTESPNFTGYQELAARDLPPPPPGPSGFLSAVSDIAACLAGRKKAPACSGRDGLLALAAAKGLLASARDGGRPVKLAERITHRAPRIS